MDEFMEYALKKNHKLTLSAFRDSVTVEHSDGSKFFIKHGHVETLRPADPAEPETFIVYGEHQTPMHFYSEDAKFTIKRNR